MAELSIGPSFNEWRDALLLREFLNVRPAKQRKAKPKVAKQTVDSADIHEGLDYLAEVAGRNTPNSNFFRFAVFVLTWGEACDDEQTNRFMRKYGYDAEELDLLKAVELLQELGA